MPLSLSAWLSSLPHLHKTALSDLWRRLFETEPPLGMRKELMLKFVAYRMQEQASGPLGDNSRRHLRELANAIEADSNIPSTATPAIKGTRLNDRGKTKSIS
jgi:hypothetical protein